MEWGRETNREDPPMQSEWKETAFFYEEASSMKVVRNSHLLMN
jgi:hypothetical protein